jgi:predicted acetyltransferase
VDVTIRGLADGELADFVAFDSVNFLDPPFDLHGFDTLDADRVRIGRDGDLLVVGGRAYGMAMTLPGGEPVPAAGIAWVSVAPTHRRRGLLRALMDELVADARDRGDVLAILTASEGGIYRRFGYGVATRWQTLRIDRARAQLVPELVPGPDEVAARCRFVDLADAYEPVARVHERFRSVRPGVVTRPESLFRATLLSTQHDAPGAHRRVVVHHDARGRPDGYAIWTGEQSARPDGTPDGTLHLQELVAIDGVGLRALWSLVLGVDLVATVSARNRPVDDPLPSMLTDVRAAAVTLVRDGVWARPLDVAAALSARRSTSDGGLVLEVVAPQSKGGGPDPAAGRWRWESGPAGASCSATDASPQVTLGLAELGALLLGGTSCHALHLAGLVDEHVPGAVAEADALFSWPVQPWAVTAF